MRTRELFARDVNRRKFFFVGRKSTRHETLPGIGFTTSFDAKQFWAIANFRIEGFRSIQIGEYLMSKHKILTIPILHDEFEVIRITPNIYIMLWELDRFCKVIEEIVRNALTLKEAVTD